MGKILFIRVSAVTYDEQSMRKAWPQLCDLAFSDDRSWTSSAGEKNVMDLITGLDEGTHYGDFPENAVENLQPHVTKLLEQKKLLEQALADHDVPKAKDLANAIEDTLTAAETAVGNVSRKS